MSNEHKTFADFKQQIVDEMKMLETDLSFYSKMTSFQIESHHDFCFQNVKN